MKYFIGILILLALIAGGITFYLTSNMSSVYNPDDTTDGDEMTEETGDDEGSETDTEDEDSEEDQEEETDDSQTTLGQSVNGNAITAYHYGEGDTEVVFVGGIHGGYAWNTVLLARELMSYLEANPNTIPDNLRVTVIPLLNPDGLEKTVGTTGSFSSSDVPTGQEATVSGRFNGNNVDLNRNFDCQWETTGVWQQRTVDAGDSPFSEPEAAAMRDYVMANDPQAVVGFYSAAGGVFASNCLNGVLSETTDLTNTYASASGYQAYESYDFYKINGDMMNWLAKENIPAISVLLTNHQDVEWSKNRAGIEAVLNYYAQ